MDVDLHTLNKFSETKPIAFRVDSRNRDKDRYPEPQEYQISLNYPLYNIVGLEVLDAQIPNTEYAIDTDRDTILYKIGAGSWQTITMTHGNYDANTFMKIFNEFAGGDLYMTYVEFYQSRARFYSSSQFSLDFASSTLARSIGGYKPVTDTVYEVDEDTPYVYQAVYVSARSRYEIDCPGLFDLTGTKEVHLLVPEIEQYIVTDGTQSQFRTGIATFQMPVDGYNNTLLDYVQLPYRPTHPIRQIRNLTMQFVKSDGELYNFRGIDHVVSFIAHVKTLKIPEKMQEDFIKGELPYQTQRLNPTGFVSALDYIASGQQDEDDVEYLQQNEPPPRQFPLPPTRFYQSPFN